MSRTRLIGRFGVAAGALIAVALIPSGASGVTPKILDWDTMVGVPRPYTGAANAIRGVPGGGVPWVIDVGRGELWTDGTIRVRVRGLVIDPNDAAAIASGIAGRNPIANFKAIVSCLSRSDASTATTVNRETGLFPATLGLGAGDATIRGSVDLPDPCIAPIVFVTSPTGSWFAATGM